MRTCAYVQQRIKLKLAPIMAFSATPRYQLTRSLMSECETPTWKFRLRVELSVSPSSKKPPSWPSNRREIGLCRNFADTKDERRELRGSRSANSLGEQSRLTSGVTTRKMDAAFSPCTRHHALSHSHLALFPAASVQRPLRGNQHTAARLLSPPDSRKIISLPSVIR